MNSLSASLPSIICMIFCAIMLTCGIAALTVFLAPLSAISPTENIFGYLGSANCIVDLTRMKPFLGLTRGSDVDGSKELISWVFGF